MNILKSLGEIVLPIFAVLGGIWAFLKLYYKYKSKFLFITNCQLINQSIWNDIKRHYKIKENGPVDYAFRPLVLLPQSLKKYISIKNGKKAVLEMVNTNSETNLKLIAEVYWIPYNLEPWNNIDQPIFSKIITRYFGIEMPIYQDETEEKIREKLADWEIVKHHNKHMEATNKQFDEDHFQWLMKKQYTHRYFNPLLGYESNPGPDNFIEYCGLSITLRNHSIIHIEKN